MSRDTVGTAAVSELIALIKNALSTKVDKVTGKGLSTNDYTTAEKSKLAGLATVATSGDYNDLDNKPTIPAAVTESTVSGWGFTKNIGTYSKPSGGIPKSDLASDVQTSLGKADTALQSHQSLSGYATEQWVGQQGYQTLSQVQTAIADAAELPSGGSAGDFLRKTSSGVAWQTVPSAEANSF